MYLTDYHTHTQISPDSSAPLEHMAQAAVDAGVQELCITDHLDLLDLHGAPRLTYDWAGSLRQFQQTAPRFVHKLQLRLGLEFGVPHTNPALAEQVLSLPQLDFVIGSIHNQSRARGGGDFDCLDYSDHGVCYEALDDYFSSMAQLVQTDYYDVLGHIIYPLRYMPEGIVLDDYWARMEHIFRIAADRGKGIEINTYRGRTIDQWRPVLELYRACGGEIITVGSDAHAPGDVGAGLREACALAADLGFRYFATYTGRRPEFHKW